MFQLGKRPNIKNTLFRGYLLKLSTWVVKSIKAFLFIYNIDLYNNIN